MFWITTDGGLKLDLARAELVAERVGDFVVYCTPNQHAVEAQEFQEGPISLTNKEHEEYSVVSVVSEPGKKGFLLELASAMTGLGVVIHEAIIQVKVMYKHVIQSICLRFVVQQHNLLLKLIVKQLYHIRLQDH